MAAEGREAVSELRDEAATSRLQNAGERDRLADERDRLADERDEVARLTEAELFDAQITDKERLARAAATSPGASGFVVSA